ncbi:uncharacterized protein LY89DRAFT_681750 [Mollisia scopiformis]|uniref:Alcohol dehydrogenase-like N-terminal domain-containing protein n=1 Tax=Mollisia scopiformis TaxID=149040 RepID=A0A194XM33_MOLSC|nr:uncharacterized protein LY89DRAFT_681750 [Mollisia scopiformis]KUJ21144.1 hypothetical protein LY89DRAFT_681750 [Mollisia scopiformis]
MVYPETFSGFQIEDPKKWTEFHLNEFKPKPFGDHDVDIKILACGVCASDLHTISGGWGEQHFPLCVGHGISSLVLRRFLVLERPWRGRLGGHGLVGVQ